MAEAQLAKATGTSLNVSPKYAFMVCQHLRGKRISEAKRIIAAVLEKHESIPFTKFNDGVGHRKGKGAAGRFPKKACEAVLMLINSAEANATDKGMSGELMIAELRANRAATRMTGGRNPGRLTKRAHIHIALAEAPARTPKKQAAKKIPAKTAEKKVEAKPATETKEEVTESKSTTEEVSEKKE